MMQRLRGLDAAFLSVETPNNHMHVAQTCVFDPSTVPGGYSFERVRQLVEDRLDLLPPFRRRLVEVPFRFHHPVWIEDPGFDLDNHLHRAAVPAPGGLAELAAFTADVVSRPLDRCQPLWEMHVVEGLEDGMVAAVAKMHHSTVDGISGAELTANLLDLEPTPAPVPPSQKPWTPERVPSALELVGSALGSLARQPVNAAVAASHVASAALRIARRNRTAGAAAPPPPFSGPPTPFNTTIGPRRRVAFTQLDLADVTAVKGAMGATVNDVVLATCAGALRAYLADRGEVGDRPLLAAVPVSTRARDGGGGAANRLSAMLVSLATTIEDPRERLAAIADGTRQAKAQDRLIAPTTLSELAQLLPPAVGAATVRFATRLRLTHWPRAAFNLVISNFPGPPVPLYCAGARLVAPYPLGPAFDGAALNITLQSYLDSLYVGLVADDRAVPDLWDLTRQLPDSLGQLCKTVI